MPPLCSAPGWPRFLLYRGTPLISGCIPWMHRAQPSPNLDFGVSKCLGGCFVGFYFKKKKTKWIDRQFLFDRIHLTELTESICQKNPYICNLSSSNHKLKQISVFLIRAHLYLIPFSGKRNCLNHPLRSLAEHSVAVNRSRLFPHKANIINQNFSHNLNHDLQQAAVWVFISRNNKNT